MSTLAPRTSRLAGSLLRTSLPASSCSPVPSTSSTTSTSSSSTSASSSGTVRGFSSSASASAKPRRQRSLADPMALKKMPKFNYDDVPTLGHQILQRKREMLQYLRTIEFEMPKLEAFRQPYTPPSASQLLRFRFQHYQGEAHPASRKVVLTVPIKPLFASGHLKTPAAQHKFLLLAGQRFRRNHPVRPSPVTGSEEDVDGEVVISCERMPHQRQNMKWCSDTLDSLIAEANAAEPDLSSLPLDPRADLVREAKKRGYARKDKPKLRDFPKHWLPSA
ncbi:37S ribosomal protein S24, mitochondrial [Thecaphora frezii]